MEPTSAAALGKSGVAITIVGRPFLFVHEDVIGFTELFEFLFGVRVFGILVGVEFDRKLAVGALDLVAASIPFDAQDFVVIALSRHYAEC